MLDYLAERHGNRPSVNENEKAELLFLRKEVPILREKLRAKADDKSTGDESSNTESSEDSNEDEVA